MFRRMARIFQYNNISISWFPIYTIFTIYIYTNLKIIWIPSYCDVYEIDLILRSFSSVKVGRN
jgi:hypothetical protein